MNDFGNRYMNDAEFFMGMNFIFLMFICVVFIFFYAFKK